MNHLLFMETWFPAPVAKAIGWTLVHSLWQGLLLTFIAGILVLFTRRSAASIRYKLLSSLLIIFVAGTALTFILEYQSAMAASQAIAAAVANPVVTSLTAVYSDGAVTVINAAPNHSILEKVSHYINQYAPLIVTTWFLIFLFKCIRLTVHIGYAQRLKHYKTSALPDLQKRLDELAALIKVKGSIIVRESGIVKAPSVIGFLKPVILLPVGLIANLPTDQVEAILLHELAHVRRKDYLVNIFQCIAETIFFFNPSVLWLSSLIRQERENCCDDMAISIIGKKATYVSALVAFQEYRSDSPYAPAFPGEKYPVLQRVKRIVYNNNKNLNNMEKIFLAGGAALCALLVFTFSTTSAQQTPKPNIANQEVRETTRRTPDDNAEKATTILLDKMTTTRDTTPTFTGTITTTHEDGKNYTLVVKNNVVKGLFIDSERVPDEKFGDYKLITDKLIQDFAAGHDKRRKAEKENMKYELAKEKNEKMKEKIEKDKMKYAEKPEEFKYNKEFEYKDKKDFDVKNDKDFKLKNKKEFDLKKKEDFKFNEQENKKEQDGNKRQQEKNKGKNEKDSRVQDKERDKMLRSIKNDKELAAALHNAENRAQQNKREIERNKKEIEDNRKAEMRNLEKEKERIEKEKNEEIKKIHEQYREYKESLKNEKQEKSETVIEHAVEEQIIKDGEKKKAATSLKEVMVLQSANGSKVTMESKKGEDPKTPRLAVNRTTSVSHFKSNDRNSLFDKNDKEKKGDQLRNQIISDLENQGLIGNRRFVMVELNDLEMRLNGKKMDTRVHENFKKRFLRTNSDRINFTSESTVAQ